MKSRHLYIVLIMLILFAAGFYLARRPSQPGGDEVKRTQVALGTIVDIQVRDTGETQAQLAMNAAFAEIRRIDTLFSTYQQRGPVCRFNNGACDTLILPPEGGMLLARCAELHEETGGAFDVAMQPLIDAWGFEGDAPAVPAAERLSAARSRSGWNTVAVHGDTVTCMVPGCGLNFGAIAKGYAVDRAMEVLRQHGIRHALVNAGGEIRATGGDWEVGIQHPRDETALLAVLRPGERAVATSGDYEQYFEQDGRRYHHILDPSTGMPARGCRSVTVLADDVLTADALATAVFVMGPRRGMEFIRASASFEALIVDSTGAVTMSPGFEQYTVR